MIVEADTVMPDRHFYTCRNEISHEQEKYKNIHDSAKLLASINNPALTFRGEDETRQADVEFRQAAFEFGHSLYRNYFCGNLTEIMPVLLHYQEQTFLKLDVDESVEDLPWEALHDGKDFLSTKLCLSRVLGSASPRSPKNNTISKFGVLLVGSDSRADLPGANTEVQAISKLLS